MEHSTTDETTARLFRENAAKFHRHFSDGEFEKNGPLVTDDIDVDSNNVKLIGRENFINRIKRYSVPFPGLQLTDRVIIVDGNVAAVNYLLQGEHKGPYGSLPASGNKIEAMSGEVFEFNPQGLMKKLITITELDRIAAQVRGDVKIASQQPVSTLANGTASFEALAKIKSAAAMFAVNFNQGRLDRDAGLATRDVAVTAGGTTLIGVDVLMERRRRLKVAFPAMAISNEYVLADGNRVAIEYIMEGSQTGPFTLPDGATLAPTGKTVRVRGLDFMAFGEAGLVNELTIVQNADDFTNQLR
jgi:predicted ester cyclase